MGRCYNQNPKVTHGWSLVFQYYMQHTEFILQYRCRIIARKTLFDLDLVMGSHFDKNHP